MQATQQATIVVTPAALAAAMACVDRGFEARLSSPDPRLEKQKPYVEAMGRRFTPAVVAFMLRCGADFDYFERCMSAEYRSVDFLAKNALPHILDAVTAMMLQKRTKNGLLNATLGTLVRFGYLTSDMALCAVSDRAPKSIDGQSVRNLWTVDPATAKSQVSAIRQALRVAGIATVTKHAHEDGIMLSTLPAGGMMKSVYGEWIATMYARPIA